MEGNLAILPFDTAIIILLLPPQIEYVHRLILLTPLFFFWDKCRQWGSYDFLSFKWIKSIINWHAMSITAGLTFHLISWGFRYIWMNYLKTRSKKFTNDIVIIFGEMTSKTSIGHDMTSILKIIFKSITYRMKEVANLMFIEWVIEAWDFL